MHRLSRLIRAIGDLTGPGVCHHHRRRSARIRGLRTAQCDRRISTFSLLSLDCLPRRSFGDDYRMLRSPSEWPSSLFFSSGLVRDIAARYLTRLPVPASSTHNHDIPARRQISLSFFYTVLLFTHRASRIRPYPPSDRSSSLSHSLLRSYRHFEIAFSFNRYRGIYRRFVKHL